MATKEPNPLFARPDDMVVWAGGSPYFNEATGQYTYPPWMLGAPPPPNFAGLAGMPLDPNIYRDPTTGLFPALDTSLLGGTYDPTTGIYYSPSGGAEFVWGQQYSLYGQPDAAQAYQMQPPAGQFGAPAPYKEPNPIFGPSPDVIAPMPGELPGDKPWMPSVIPDERWYTVYSQPDTGGVSPVPFVDAATNAELAAPTGGGSDQPSQLLSAESQMGTTDSPGPTTQTFTPTSTNYMAPTAPTYSMPSGSSGQYQSLLQQAMGAFQPYLTPQYNDQGLTPYMQAAIQNYELNILPAIQNQYALIGLGSSPAMAEGVAAGYYSMLPQALQLQQQAQIAAAQGAGTLAGIDTQRYGIDQSTALGYAGLDVQRYGIDQNTNLGYAGLDTQRYGIDQQSAAQAAMRELQAQQIALQGELGYGSLANQASQNELMQRQLALQAYGLAGQLQQNQYQMELDAYYNEMMRLQNLGIFALSGGFGAPVGNQTTQSSSGGK